MVNTRGAASGASDESAHVSPSHGPPIDPEPQPPKVSREMRKLMIDANPALGGNGSRKRKRGHSAHTAQPNPPTPPRSHSVSTSHNSPPVVAADQSAPDRGITVRVSVDPDTSEHTVNHHTGSGDPADSLAFKGRLSTGDDEEVEERRYRSFQRRESPARPWFLPDGTAEPEETSAAHQSPVSTHKVRRQTKSSGGESRRRIKVAHTPRSQRGRAVHTQTLPQEPATLEKGGVTGKGYQGTPKSKRLSREMRRLQIDANPSLALGNTSEAHEIEVLPSSSHKDKQDLVTVKRETSPNALPAQDELPRRPKASREIRKLMIDANPSLGGNVHATDTGSAQSKRRKPRATSTHPLAARRPTKPPARIRSANTERLTGAMQTFPSNPPAALADHVLYLFAEAAGELDIIRAISTNAQQAIWRDVRLEPSHQKQARIDREQDIVNSWDVLGDGPILAACQSVRKSHEQMNDAKLFSANSGPGDGDVPVHTRPTVEALDGMLHTDSARELDLSDQDSSSADDVDDVIENRNFTTTQGQQQNAKSQSGETTQSNASTHSLIRRWKGKGRAVSDDRGFLTQAGHAIEA